MAPVPKKSRLDDLLASHTSSNDGSPSGYIRFEGAVAVIAGIGVCSPQIEVLGLPWYLKVRKHDNKLWAYLCHRASDCDMWRIDVSAEFFLINNDDTNLVKKFNYIYNNKSAAMGLALINWEGLMENFVRNGKIVIESRFALSNVVGFRTHSLVDFTDSNEPCHDVALVINGQKIYASKQILSIHSAKFKTLFYGDPADQNRKEFKMEDVRCNELLEMLNRIYPSYTKISDANAQSLLKLSDRSQTKSIFDQVERFLINSSKFSTLVKLDLSDRYKLIKLQEHVLSSFLKTKHIAKLQYSPDYDALSSTAKATLLEKFMKLSRAPVPPNAALVAYDDSQISSDGSPSGFICFEVAVSDVTPYGINSPVIEVYGLPWYLKVKNSSELRVYLYHRSSDSDIWSIDVSAEIMLINIDLVKSEHGMIDHTFSHKSSNQGPHFLSKWEDIVNVKNGFVTGGKITIEARFILYNIKGIRIHSHVDFTDPKEPFHDVALVIGGKTIYVSKQILAVHSPVFKAMFYGDYAERNKKEIELKDVDREEFIAMLYLIYPSYKKITDANAESLLKLADRFQINIIVDQVEQFLINSNKWNIPAKLNLSEQYRLVSLQEFCLSTFKTANQIMDLKKTDGFEALSKNMKGTLLEKAMKLG